MKTLFKILKFFRITDENSVISITNLFMFIVMYKIMNTPALSMKDISIVLIVIVNYSYKKKLIKEKNEI